MPDIPVSEYVKAELDQLLADEDHTSYDSLIRVLLGNYDQV